LVIFSTVNELWTKRRSPRWSSARLSCLRRNERKEPSELKRLLRPLRALLQLQRNLRTQLPKLFLLQLKLPKKLMSLWRKRNQCRVLIKQPSLKNLRRLRLLFQSQLKFQLQ